MGQVTYTVGPAELAVAWRAVGRQFAVIAGSATALISLFQDTPVWVASARGAGAWAAVLAVTSVGAWLATRTWVALPPEVEPEADPGADQEAVSGPEAVPAALRMGAEKSSKAKPASRR